MFIPGGFVGFGGFVYDGGFLWDKDDSIKTPKQTLPRKMSSQVSSDVREMYGTMNEIRCYAVDMS